MARSSTLQTDVADLGALYRRNIARMARVRPQPFTIQALWWGGCRQLDSWRIIPSAQYPSWRLYWNDRPGGVVLFDGGEFPLGPDRVMAIPPRTPISCRLNSPVRHFHANFLLGYPYGAVSSQVLCAALCDHLQEVARELASVRRDVEDLSPRQTANLQVLIGLLLRDIDVADLGPQPTDRRIRKTLELLDVDCDLSNAELAQSAGMSTNGFHRLFREQVGVTPHAYVLEKKVALACSLLQHTGKTVEAISGECGFNDRAYLARVFRRRFGVSPGEYRRLQADVT